MKPHLRKMWCIPPGRSGELVYHMGDVPEVYRHPHGPARPVVCLGEAFKQLIGEAREPRPPGQVERYDSACARNGVADVFMTFEPPAGRRHVEPSGARPGAGRAGPGGGSALRSVRQSRTSAP